MSAPQGESSFTFYPAEVDGDPAAFVVDLEQEPRNDLRTRIVVAVPMRDPSEDGLRSDDETGTLDRVQEMIMNRIEEAYSAVLVGFYDLKGTATLVFYAKSGKITPAAVAQAVGDIGPYGIDVHVADDPEWTFYIEVLFPDDYALQGIWNRALVAELEANGDTLDEPRQVDHLARFSSKAEAEKAAKALSAAHFKIDDIGEDETEKGAAITCWAVAFHRKETLEDDKPNRFSAEVLDIILPFDGEYDGWGAPAVTGEEDEEEVPPSGEHEKPSVAPPPMKKKAPAKKAPAKKAKASPKKKTVAAKTKKKAPAAKKPKAAKKK